MITCQLRTLINLDQSNPADSGALPTHQIDDWYVPW